MENLELIIKLPFTLSAFYYHHVPAILYNSLLAKNCCKIQNYKTPRDNIGENLYNLGYGDDFLHTTPKAQSMKERIDKLDVTNIKNFGFEKINVKEMRRQATDWQKRFAKYLWDKEPLSKIYKQHLKLNSKKTNNLIEKWAKDLNRHLTKEDMQMTDKHMKRCSTTYVI